MLFDELPVICVQKEWEEAIFGVGQLALEDAVAEYLQRCRWFGGKARPMVGVRVRETIRVAGSSSPSYILILAVQHEDGPEAMYVLPVIHIPAREQARILRQHPEMAIARLHVIETGQDGLLCDAFVDRTFCTDLLSTMIASRSMEGRNGVLRAFASADMGRRFIRPGYILPEPSVLSAEQSNTSVLFGQDFLLKVFRHLEEGENPEYEVGRFLTKAGFRNIPPVLGGMEYRQAGQEPFTMAILHGYVPNESDAWTYTLDALGRFFERVLDHQAMPPRPSPASLLGMSETDPDVEAERWLGSYIESARLLGERTAELHAALASSNRDPAFVPEPFTPVYQETACHRLCALAEDTFRLLGQRLDEIPGSDWPAASRVLERRGAVLDYFWFLRRQELSSLRIRCHGDYHLGQVLYTGTDLILIDFEGEPAQPLSERRDKSSPLKDVSGMLRSFEYAVGSALIEAEKNGMLRGEDRLHLESWGEYWSRWACACFLQGYLRTAREAGILPRDRREFSLLLGIHLLEKAIYELSYELNNRPTWVSIPLRGILRLVETDETGASSFPRCGIDVTTDCTCLLERYP